MNEYELASAEVFAERDPVELVALGPMLLAEFARAKEDRRDVEERWLQDLRQFRGKYDPDVEADIGANKSRAFVRKTRVKVKTLNSRVSELLFPAGSEKNWEVEPTPVPTLTAQQTREVEKNLQAMLDMAHQQQMMMAQQQGVNPATIPPARLAQKDIDAAIVEIAKQSAKKMSKVIDDQLAEARYKEVSLKAIHSCHLYGTGIIKGPLVERKLRTSFTHENGKWTEKSESYVSPFLDFVPLWRFYPDMGANEIDGCRFAFEEHTFTQSDLAELADRKSFDGQRIKDYIRGNPQGRVTDDNVTTELKAIGERPGTQGVSNGLYTVLERWGWLRGEDLKASGVEVPEDRCHEMFFSNVWLLPDGQVIKAVLQPINGVTWPYHIYYFDKDETSIFGEGLAAIMRDDQTMINAATRMILDNAAITAGPMIEVNTGLLSRLDNVTEVGPWKVWLRNANNPGQRAITPVELPSNLAALSGLVQMFENNADEVSAVPRYMSGENVNNGAAGTASGMSMLMGAVNIIIKDLVTAWDEGVTRPFLSAMYRWNMQFNPDQEIKGDYNVKARGTASLVAKEVRTRQLNEFAAMTANPLDGPFIKRDKLLRYRAEANELSDVVKTEEEVKGESGQAQAQQQQMQEMQMKLQMAEMEAKIAKLTAEAEKTGAQTQLAMAQAQLTQAKAIESKVEAIYAALQAGGVAASNPMIAPAGDEILKSAGFSDATPDPSIAGLMDERVQGAPMDTPQGVDPVSGQLGARAGIETVNLEEPK